MMSILMISMSWFIRFDRLQDAECSVAQPEYIAAMPSAPVADMSFAMTRSQSILTLLPVCASDLFSDS